MAKINKVLVGEALVGDGNEVAHIDLIIGPRGSPAETAFCNGLVNNKHGFTSLLAVIAPNLPCKPNTLMFNKVTINDARQAVQMFGPAQYGVAKAVQDAVAEGIIPADEADDLFILVGVFIHWEAADDAKIQKYNYDAVKLSIQRAVKGEPHRCLRHRAAQLRFAPLRVERLDRGQSWAERASARTAGPAPATGFHLPRTSET